jgi:prefoldin alpha subunit
MNQEQIIKIQLIEQESNQLNQQLELIEQNITEFIEINKSLEEIENSNKKEILANLGKRIYISVEIKSKKLIMEVGNKIFVKKSIPETMELINEQVKKLISGKDNIMFQLESLQEKVNQLMEEFEEERKKEDSKEKK